MEDKRLHEVPVGWKSDTKKDPFLMAIPASMFSAVGLFTMFFLGEWVRGAVVLAIGLVPAFLVLRRYFDNKDDWYVIFSCSSLLYLTLIKNTENYLSATQAEIRKNETTGANTFTTQYRLTSFPYFTIGIERTSGDISATKVTINDIRIGSTDEAKVLVDVVNHIIKESRKMVVNAED